MLKILLDPNEGRFRIETENTPVLQIACDLCYVVYEIYNTIYASDKIYAELFRASICAGVTAKDTPTWKIKHDPARKAECYVVAVPSESEE